MLNRIQVMVTDEMLQVLDAHSKTYGLSRSAMCNYLMASALLSLKDGNKDLKQLLPKRGDK